MRKITGDIFGCYYFNCFHSYITQVTCQKGKAPLHTHTHIQLQFISIPVCLWNSWSSMSYEGSIWQCSCSPNIAPLRSQSDNNSILCQEFGSWFCTVVKVLGLSICPWTADYPQWEKFTVGQIQHVLGGAVLASPSSPSALFRVNCHHPQLE